MLSAQMPQSAAHSVARALDYLSDTALRHDFSFDSFGYDFALCFDGVAVRLPPSAEALRRRARRDGRALAQRMLAQLEATTTPPSLRQRVYALFAARRFGLEAPALDAAVRAELAARPSAATRLLPFDPASEPPPADAFPLPRAHPFAHIANNAYAAWSAALTTAHALEELSLPGGVRVADALRWLPSLRPYRTATDGGGYVGFHDQAHALAALTHTLTDYGRRGCDGRRARSGGGGGAADGSAAADVEEEAAALELELRALNSTVAAALDDGDVSLAAAAAGALQLCGGGEAEAEAEAEALGGARNATHAAAVDLVVDFLLSTQRADGGWSAVPADAPPLAPSPQERYAPTCSAAFALASRV